MKLKDLLGTDIKENLKKVVFKFKNRNFKPYVVDKTLFGTDFKFYVANLDGKNWYIDGSESPDGSWVWPEMEFVKNHIVAPGDVVLECGGHHGLTAVVISKWVGSKGHVHTFEPNPDNQAILQKNIEINSATNVTIVPNAVGEKDGSIMISHSSSNSYILKGKEQAGIEVAIVKADDFLHLKPTVIKIDVEGFETDVLKGATEILKTLPKLAIELHPDMMGRYGTSVKELLSLISPQYNLWVQWEILKAPVPYDCAKPITDRAHLFAIPKND